MLNELWGDFGKGLVNRQLEFSSYFVVVHVNKTDVIQALWRYENSDKIAVTMTTRYLIQ